MAKVTSISSLGWAHYTLYEALPRIAALGFSRMEIASLGSYCFHFHFGSPTPAELKKMLDDLNLEPVCLNYSTGMSHAWEPSQIDEYALEWERKLVQLPEVGIPSMCMHFGVRNDRPDQQAQLANAVKFYNRVGEFAAKHGVRMLLEIPHLYNIMYRPEQVLWVFDRLESDNVGALIDSSHWGIIGYDIDQFVAALGPRLWHMHLRDSSGPDTADQQQALEKTPGAGTVDFKKLADTLDKVRYAGDVSLDFEYRDMTLQAIDQEFDKGLRYLKQVGWELPATVEKKLDERSL